MSAMPASAVSFRDPDAVLVSSGERVFRVVRTYAAAGFAEMIDSPAVRAAMASGQIVSTWRCKTKDLPESLRDVEGDMYEHETVRFVTYPCEWSPAMLVSASDLTLGLAESLLVHGFVLKDATPANVLFRDGKPVFVDLPSVVARQPGQYLWLARQQFEATFLLPLIASSEAGIPLSLSLQNPVVGLSHESVARLLGWRRWLKPRLAATVALPAVLSRRAQNLSADVRNRVLADDRRAAYILQQSFRRMRLRLESFAADLRSTESAWHDYTRARGHYQDEDLRKKKEFVERALDRVRPAYVLDVGANTGEFSQVAARYGPVLALEGDPASADLIFRRANEERLAISPLVANFARPTPGFGWRNRETTALVDRLRGRFDLVLMMAVIHHLRVTEGVPLRELVDMAAEIATKALLIEHVPPTDPMFRRIARGRELLYADCGDEAFRTELERRFSIERSERLRNGRTLYLALVPS